jgi:carboxypeptidase C (cathepsin A)
MSNGKDILSVIFLALICIVISGIVSNLVPNHSGLIVPSFVFISICLWIAYDYMMLNRYKAKEQCMNDRFNLYKTQINTDEINTDEINTDEINDYIPLNADEKKQHILVKKNDKDDFDIDLYNGQHSIQDMHSNMACSADNQVCNRMKYMGIQPQLSQNIRAAYNKYTLQPFLEEEFKENANREWWNSDHLEAVF